MPSAATVFTHWKSTTQGLLVLAIATCQVLMAAGDLTPHATKIVNLVLALAFAYVGIISKDSGVVVAQVGTREPKAVASTEVPLDPKAKVVVEGKN